MSGLTGVKPFTGNVNEAGGVPPSLAPAPRPGPTVERANDPSATRPTLHGAVPISSTDLTKLKGNAPYAEPVDQWAVDNPDLARMADEIGRKINEGNTPMKSNVGVMLDNATMHAANKLSGVVGRFLPDGIDWSKYGENEGPIRQEFYERVANARSQSLEEGASHPIISTLVGGALGPGKAKSLVGMIGENAALTATDAYNQNLTSEGLEGVGEAALGGAAVSGAIGGVTKPVRALTGLMDPQKAPRVAPTNTNAEAQVLVESANSRLGVTGSPADAGREFSNRLHADVIQAKTEAKGEIEGAINEGFSFVERAGPRLQMSVRTNVSDRLAKTTAPGLSEKGLSGDATPSAARALELIDQFATTHPDSFKLRDLDNLILEIKANKPVSKADQIAQTAVLDEIQSYADVSQYQDLMGNSHKLTEGRSEVLDRWRAGRKDASRYLSIEDAETAAGRRLKKIYDSGEEMTGEDIADYIWGTANVGSKREALGVVNALKKGFGDNAESLSSLRNGMISTLTRIDPDTPGHVVAKRIDTFLGDQRDLAEAIYSKEQIAALEGLAGSLRSLRAEKLPEAAKSRVADSVGQWLAKLTAMTAGSVIGSSAGPVGTAVGAVVGSEAGPVIGKTLNWAAMGIDDASRPVAKGLSRTAGQDVGETIDAPVADFTAGAFNRLPPVSYRDSLINQLQGVQ